MEGGLREKSRSHVSQNLRSNAHQGPCAGISIHDYNYTVYLNINFYTFFSRNICQNGINIFRVKSIKETPTEKRKLYRYIYIYYLYNTTFTMLDFLANILYTHILISILFPEEKRKININYTLLESF